MASRIGPAAGTAEGKPASRRPTETSFVVDEPTTLLLLASAMLGLAILLLFRRVASGLLVQPGHSSSAVQGTASAWPGHSEAPAQRLLDIVMSVTLLALTMPLLILIAVLIRLDSPGPALYRQERVGLHGRRFTMLKFRSMCTDAEPRGPVWAAKRDPRITRVGLFTRFTHIDELPQLLNILRGDMSFVGPRPERPHFVEQLEQVLPRYRERVLVKPGLTGWAQVNYPYGASVDDARAKLSYDLHYIRHRGFLLDMLILWRTARVVLFRGWAR